MTHISDIALIILAAGKGTRMKSPLPKVLHAVGHRPMVLRCLDAAQPLKPKKTVMITGYAADQVQKTVSEDYPNVGYVHQAEQLGTGHAVKVAKEALKGFEGTVVILYGDAAILPSEPLQKLVDTHHQNGNDLTLVTGQMDAPKGLGRIMRGADGAFLGSVEEKEATPEQLKSREINPCLYALKSDVLWDLLDKIDNKNSKNEYYLTDIEKLALKGNLKVEAIDGGDGLPLVGCNSRVELTKAETYFQNKMRKKLLENGIIMQAPETVFFAWDTQVAEGVTIDPYVVFGEGVRVVAGAHIKSFSHLEGAVVGQNTVVGPHARLRPGTVVEEDARIGNFVEVKKATIGKGSKVNHLSYVGDATIGEDCNIGAGTIFANYNHKKKEKNAVTLGKAVSTGANSVLVAPVRVSDDAMIAAGTTIRKDVEARALVVDTCDQVVKKPK